MTRRRMTRRLLLAAAVLLGTTAVAEAHHPTCRCRMETAETVLCTGGFSDGSGAPGVVIDVIGQNEEMLIPGRLGADSTVRFRRPDRGFYVLMDAGPGHTVEIGGETIR